jgi:trans-2,3-dihydro-3-hydroxyanthranilate isomerase
MTVVRACLRDGHGGSPTVVLDEAGQSDEERRRVPVALGTSHAVFVAARGGDVALRFFTAAAELPACGHGTVAALAYLARRGRYQGILHTPAGSFAGRAEPAGAVVSAAFDAGSVALREPTPDEPGPVLRALGVPAHQLAGPTVVATRGRPRLLVPVTSRAALAALAPDLPQLRAACDRLGLLGSYVYYRPAAGGRLAARMFAPSIGVPEDIANANSTACLAAHLARDGITGVVVDMGDALGAPATITATWDGGRVEVGATATMSPRD